MNSHLQCGAAAHPSTLLNIMQVWTWAAVVLALSVIAPAHAFGFGSKKSETHEANDGKSTPRTDATYDDALAKIKVGDYADSIPLLQQSLMTNPNNADALNELGHSLRKVGRLQDSLLAYQKALTLNPKHVNATEYLGELYLQMEQPDLARKQLEALALLCPSGCEQRTDLQAQIDAYRR